MIDKGKKSIFNLPNTLSFFRIGCIPLLVVLLFFPHKTTSFLAALVFGLASISDLLDGFVARRHQMVTTFGQFLDPLADKLLVSAALIMLIPLGRVPAWMVLVIIGRELAIMGLRSVAGSEGKVITADHLGKQKMVLQTVAILGLLLHYDYYGVNFHAVGMFFLWLAVIMTLWSGFNYFRNFWHVLEENDSDSAGS
ncbi:MAG: CDP-diacylglycerol--glycerol-3-phosphate 3-phosphatidyltransferase [Deltaproteobacteria bacterium]|jgi:CDP-diacylglycerol--glycerol-3-phosphate 3-phosphatidyltransferase|nr:CDP-diacylglycerol--glycerol-3-phosphate 3-phosphatidyltransferase [Deltaproteobacteria bacterium]MDH3803089.1 CDP-diacylglycerol--glycerol-3-phosphate 3-phosphatidyltransferase [Deltaproteobacteria bacterium]MDH3852254.1 CDP-diacylglycerol--glycerol-3-phosphate 3-phosphatidyltransferase [Deltaproteobacteria bacterium]MDH3897873.1 CDP-diacylglycerol--glycerol-3-phosphate 3-phosphatidyltransferase [Deltaproteobacteria bacterium]MDH3929748.1 CDP-diacylglycerol--glycerol-3-phosphate 3-phosphati